MRIFFITSKLNFKTAGGSVTELDLLARTLIKFGNKVKVVTAFSRSNLITNPLPYPVVEENISSRRLLGIQLGSYRILKKYSNEADFFYIDGNNFLYGAGFYRKTGGKVPVAAFFNRELVSWPEHISHLFDRPREKDLAVKIKKKARWCIERYLGMPLANYIDILAFTNPFLRKAYENFGLKRKPSGDFIISDPFDYKTLMEKNNITKDFYIKRNKKDGKIILFYSSRMAAGKGFDILLKAFSEVKNKDNFRLILGGTGPEEPFVRQTIRDLRLKQYVELPGWVSKEKLYESLKTFDIFIQPRWRMDLTSCSLLDAMAFGLPSILPAGGGLEWDAKNSALYFKDGDVHDLARKIDQLGDDYQLREQLSRNCYQRLAEDEMNYEKQAERLNELMKEFLRKS